MSNKINLEKLGDKKSQSKNNKEKKDKNNSNSNKENDKINSKESNKKNNAKEKPNINLFIVVLNILSLLSTFLLF